MSDARLAVSRESLVSEISPSYRPHYQFICFLTEHWFITAAFKFHAFRRRFDQVKSDILGRGIGARFYLNTWRQVGDLDSEAKGTRETVAVADNKRTGGSALEARYHCK